MLDPHAPIQIFAGNLYGTGSGGYSTWINFDGSGEQVNDDPSRHDYNVDQWVDKFVQDALDQHSHSLSEHQVAWDAQQSSMLSFLLPSPPPSLWLYRPAVA